MAKVQEIRPTPAELRARAHKIDELGEITRRLQLVEPDQAREKVLREEIQGWHEDDAADECVVERGELYALQLSPRRNERTVTDKKKLFNAVKGYLGIDGLIAIWNIPLGEVDNIVPESLQKSMITKERSGNRTFKIVPLYSPASDESKKAA